MSVAFFREFLGQGWMKVDKNERTPYIMKTSQHFNDVNKQRKQIKDLKHSSRFDCHLSAHFQSLSLNLLLSDE